MESTAKPRRFRVLLVESDKATLYAWSAVLESDGWVVRRAQTGASAIELTRGTINAAVVDFDLTDTSGPDVVRALKEHQNKIAMVIVDNAPSTQRAFEAGRSGASCRIEGPIDPDRFAEELRKVRQALVEPPAKVSDHSRPQVIGSSPGLTTALAKARLFGVSQANVLIQGPTGSGKELIAREMHYRSSRAAGPFVALNCAAIPSELLESELFGYKKGAFTGAVTDRPGLLEEAEGGTLLLDEIGDMRLDLQAKLLRVLQERRFRPVGSTEERAMNVRIVSTTHVDLGHCARKGHFREDLYYRLANLRITVPPLYERKEDIESLCEHFIRAAAVRHSVAPKRLDSACLERLLAYHWPGNIRELESAMEHAVIFASDDGDREAILVGDLPDDIALTE